MKCDEFLPSLETGGPIRRWRARRHAASCPQCAAALQRWMAAKEALSQITLDAPPLSDWDRSVWLRAAETAGVPSEEFESDRDLAAARRWRIAWPKLAGLAVAAACVVVVVVQISHRNPPAIVKDPTPAPPTRPTELARVESAVAVEPVPQARQLDELSAAVERLSADLQTLRQQAERSNAQRQVAMALDRYGRW